VRHVLAGLEAEGPFVRTWRWFFQSWQLERTAKIAADMLDLLEEVYPLSTFRNGNYSSFGQFNPLEAWIGDAYVKGLLKMEERQRLIHEIHFVSELDPPQGDQVLAWTEASFVVEHVK
jgi:hypothetical protein